MKKTQRIDMVQRVVDEHERRKAQALALCEQRVREAQSRLEELEGYRSAYVRDFSKRAQAGLDGAGVREYQVFLSRLDEALHHQSQIVTQAEFARTAELENWRSAARRAAAVDTLAKHWRAEEQRVQDRRDQHETDERSQQSWSRRSHLRVS
ncbi:MAG: flagellar export protein FliJ [Steroidobacteraceae bacterium]